MSPSGRPIGPGARNTPRNTGWAYTMGRWLGVVADPPEQGMATEHQGGTRLPRVVCATCGALVAGDAQELHRSWHARIGG